MWSRFVISLASFVKWDYCTYRLKISFIVYFSLSLKTNDRGTGRRESMKIFLRSRYLTLIPLLCIIIIFFQFESPSCFSYSFIVISLDKSMERHEINILLWERRTLIQFLRNSSINVPKERGGRETILRAFFALENLRTPREFRRTAFTPFFF